MAEIFQNSHTYYTNEAKLSANICTFYKWFKVSRLSGQTVYVDPLTFTHVFLFPNFCLTGPNILPGIIQTYLHNPTYSFYSGNRSKMKTAAC